MEDTYYPLGGTFYTETFDDVYEEVNSMLQDDNLYKDTEEIIESFENDIITGMAPHFPLICFYFFGLILVSLMPKGIFRNIYVIKAMALFCLSVSILVRFNVLHIKADLKFEKISESPLVNKQVFYNNESAALSVNLLLMNIFRTVDEASSLILLHELYMCITKMESRKQSWCRLFKKVVASVVMSLLVDGSNQAFRLISDKWWEIILRRALPLQTLSSLGVTAGCVYCSFHVISALRKSQEFRNSAASASEVKRDYLTLLVAATVIAQITKLVAEWHSTSQALSLCTNFSAASVRHRS